MRASSGAGGGAGALRRGNGGARGRRVLQKVEGEVEQRVRERREGPPGGFVASRWREGEARERLGGSRRWPRRARARQRAACLLWQEEEDDKEPGGLGQRAGPHWLCPVGLLQWWAVQVSCSGKSFPF